VSEVGGSNNIEFFSSGYDRKYVATGMRSGTDWIRLLGLRLHRVVLWTHYEDGTNNGNAESSAGKGRCRYKADREELKEIMDANTKAMREDVKCGQAEIRSIVGAFQENMDACVAHRRDARKETMSCLETTEAHVECEEQTSVDTESEEKHPEVSKEHAVVETGKALKSGIEAGS
jgi:hypothetical protein